MYFVTFLVKNLLRRKVRSSLTISAVAVAVGTLVVLVGISHGFEQATIDSFEKRGVDIVVVARGMIDQLNSDLDESIGDRIARLPGVRIVTPGLLELVEVPRNQTVISVLVQGWRLDNPAFKDLHLRSGRLLQPEDQHSCVLGESLANNLGKHTGDAVSVQGEDFQVVGVYHSFSRYENGGLIMPLGELQTLMAREHRVTGFSLVLDHNGTEPPPVAAVCAQIEDLHDDYGRPLKLSAAPTEEYVAEAPYIRLAHAMAWLTTVVAMIIGSIGMLNTMVMSVFERTREIGILRALGWRKARVVSMIVGEALLLSLAGAVVGTLGATLLARWLTTFPAVSGFISGTIAPEVILRGLGLALLVGLLGGLYPAVHAARLLPTEALRHE